MATPPKRPHGFYIPYTKADYAAAYRQCVEEVAYATGFDRHITAFIVNRFFEAIVDRVIHDPEHLVRIPCFGAFGIRIHTPKMPGKLPYATAAFYPSKSFHREVGFKVSSKHQEAHDQLQRYRDNNAHWRINTTNANIKNELRKQREGLLRRAQRQGSLYKPVTR